MRKVDNEEKETGKKVMMEIVATDVAASPLPEW